MPFCHFLALALPPTLTLCSVSSHLLPRLVLPLWHSLLLAHTHITKILKRINPLKFLTSYFSPYDHDQTPFSALYSSDLCSAIYSYTFECRYCILLIFTHHNSYLQWPTYNGCLINNRSKLNFKRCYSIILPAQF